MARSSSRTCAAVVTCTAAATISARTSRTAAATQFGQARDVYFNRCAGCHGLYRTGATGPNIGEARAEWIGTEGLGALLRHGTPRGMPNFGTSGVVSEAEVTLLTSFLQDPPPTPPSLALAAIQASWTPM